MEDNWRGLDSTWLSICKQKVKEKGVNQDQSFFLTRSGLGILATFNCFQLIQVEETRYEIALQKFKMYRILKPKLELAT